MNSAILTIDDFPAKNTPAIVDDLTGKGIRAVFFATGQNVEKHREEAIYALQHGMIVGNHSYSHPGFSALSLAECIAEIENCERILDQLYEDSGVQRLWRPFRFPYGDKGGANQAALQEYLRRSGFHKLDDAHIPYSWWQEYHLNTDIDTFWTFDFEEYRLWQDSAFTWESIRRKMHDQHPASGAVLFGENNRHILLMHNFDETEAVLPEYWKVLTGYLLDRGLVFDEPRFLPPQS